MNQKNQKKMNRITAATFLTGTLLALGLTSGCYVGFHEVETVRYGSSTTYNGSAQKVVVGSPESEYGKFENIYIKAPILEAVVVPSSDSKLRVSAVARGPNSAEIAWYLKGSSKEVSPDGRSITITIGGGAYSCSYASETLGNTTVVTVKGVCIDSIEISMPDDCKANIYVNGKPVKIPGPMTMDDLSAALRAQTWDNDKIETIRMFIASHRGESPFVTIDDIRGILSTMTWDNGKLDALRLFRDHVIDPQHVTRLKDVFTWDNNKIKAVEVLLGD